MRGREERNGKKIERGEGEMGREKTSNRAQEGKFEGWQNGKGKKWE